jgi:hypothetical protein
LFLLQFAEKGGFEEIRKIIESEEKVTAPVSTYHWVVPENMRTPTTGGILEFRGIRGGCRSWNSMG